MHSADSNQNEVRKPIVLIVDDVVENIDILSIALTSDYQVKAATNGQTALKVVAAQPAPDIILLDIMMPGMDGHEVCRLLKADASTRDIPVIFITAKVDVRDELAGLQLGAVDYITKPVSIPIMQARIKTHLTVSLQRRQLASQNLELKKAAKLRENLERIVRHDLKSPLAVIMGYAQLLSVSRFMPGKWRYYVRQIESASCRLLSLINMSMDVYKMEEGYYDLNPKAIDLLKMIEAIRQELQFLSVEKKNPVMIDVRNGKEFVIAGNALLCHSLFTNLVKNGIEASPVGSPVHIGISQDHAGIRITVHNAGAVPEEIRDRFFGKFVTSGKPSGTGLGTYAARLIAQLHQADISMETSARSGTLITVIFPLNVKIIAAKQNGKIHEKNLDG